MQYRKDEQETVRFRTDRFFAIDTKWYFATREGENVGPFTSRNQALAAANRYIASRGLSDQQQGEAEYIKSGSVWDRTGYVN